MKHNCTDCHQPIPAGLAVLRSSNFRAIAWHRDCYLLHQTRAQMATEGLLAV